MEKPKGKSLTLEGPRPSQDLSENSHMFEIAQFIHPENGTGQDRVFARAYRDKVVLAVADGAGGRSGGAE